MMDSITPQPPPLPPQPPLPSLIPASEVPVAIEFQNAGFWRRVGAFLLDSIIIGIAGWIVGLIFASGLSRMGGWERLIGFGIAALYFVPLNGPLGRGQTLGKKAFAIRVVSKEGTTLGAARSFVRSVVLMLPHFLNGAPIGVEKLGTFGAIALAEAVFGLGLSILYLLAYNARTRQSLHDLVVGSYVVKVGSEAAEKPRIWAFHYVPVALILVVVAVVPIVAETLMKNWLPTDLMTAYTAIQEQPEVAGTQLFAGQNLSWNTQGRRASTAVTLSVRVIRVEDRDAEANKLVAILLAKYPDAGTKDVISVNLSEGYDLGIASWFWRYGFNFSPAQWRERIEGKAPAS